MKKTDEYMSELRGENCGERFLRNVRYQVSFLTVARLLGTFIFSQSSLINLDLKKYSFEEVKKTWEDILSVIGDVDKCNTWRGKSISLFISKSVADVEGISNFVVIDNKKSNRKKEKFTQEFLEEVKRALPEQPWPKGIHIFISKRIGVSPKTVAIAIGELMNRNMVKRQKDGKIIE